MGWTFDVAVKALASRVILALLPAPYSCQYAPWEAAVVAHVF